MTARKNLCDSFDNIIDGKNYDGIMQNYHI